MYCTVCICGHEYFPIVWDCPCPCPARFMISCFPSHFPARSTEVSDCGNYVILYVNRGAEPKNLLYYCDLRELPDGGDIRGTMQCVGNCQVACYFVQSDQRLLNTINYVLSHLNTLCVYSGRPRGIGCGRSYCQMCSPCSPCALHV